MSSALAIARVHRARAVFVAPVFASVEVAVERAWIAALLTSRALRGTWGRR
jgi:hypothetical protein